MLNTLSFRLFARRTAAAIHIVLQPSYTLYHNRRTMRMTTIVSPTKACKRGAFTTQRYRHYVKKQDKIHNNGYKI